MRMFFWLAVLGIVGYGVVQSPAVSMYRMEQKLGIERIGDWQVACIPNEPKCQAMLLVEKGSATAKRGQGDFLGVKLRVFLTPDGDLSANVTYDKEVPRFNHTTALDAVRIDDGAKFSPLCRQGACEISSGSVDRFVTALRGGRSMEVEPREGNSVLVAVHGFDAAWARLREKAPAHVPADLPLPPRRP